MSGLPEIGRVLVVLGAALMGVGALLTFAGRLPWLGRLPGDIVIRRGGLTLYVPLATSLLVSLLLTLLFSLWRR
jgi:Protein of unknown function (DUF2905)